MKIYHFVPQKNNVLFAALIIFTASNQNNLSASLAFLEKKIVPCPAMQEAIKEYVVKNVLEEFTANVSVNGRLKPQMTQEGLRELAYFRPKELPFCIKLNPISRLAGAKILQETITTDSLNLIGLPWQIQYNLPIDIWTKGINTRRVILPQQVCIAEWIKEDLAKQLTIEQAHQLYAVMKKTKFADVGMSLQNLIQESGTEKLYIIDTEKQGFNDPMLFKMALHMLSTSPKVSPEAKEYFTQTLKK